MLICIRAVSAYPNRMEPTCQQATVLAGGGGTTMHGTAGAPGTAMTVTQGGVAMTDGGTYTPGAPITVANSGGGQYGIWTSQGTFPGGLCGGQMTEEGGAVTAPASGPLTLVGMRCQGKVAITYQVRPPSSLRFGCCGRSKLAPLMLTGRSAADARCRRCCWLSALLLTTLHAAPRC